MEKQSCPQERERSTKEKHASTSERPVSQKKRMPQKWKSLIPAECQKTAQLQAFLKAVSPILSILFYIVYSEYAEIRRFPFHRERNY
jgi:hypothetical protein